MAQREQRRERTLKKRVWFYEGKLLPFMGGQPIRSVTRHHAQAAVDAWGASRGAATIRWYRAMASTPWREAVEAGLIEHNPWRQVVVPRAPTCIRGREEVMPVAQLERLLTSPRIPLLRRAAYATTAMTGARSAEVCGMLQGDYLPTKPLARVRIRRQMHNLLNALVDDTKTGIDRDVPAHPVLDALLSAHHAEAEALLGRELCPEDPLLVCVTSKGEARHWRSSALRSSLHKDLDALGIPEPVTGPQRVHGLRHTFTTQLARAGCPERIVETFTHNSAPKTPFQGYLHYSWEDLCRGILRLQFSPEAMIGLADERVAMSVRSASQAYERGKSISVLARGLGVPAGAVARMLSAHYEAGGRPKLAARVERERVRRRA